MSVDQFFSDLEAVLPSTSYFQVAQSVQDLGFQILFLRNRRVFDNYLSVPYYSYIPAFFKLVFPSFMWSSSFLAGCFGILWFCILSAWPNPLVGRILQNFTIFPRSNTSLSPFLFLLSRVAFLDVSIFFLSLPFNYSDCVGFFHGHYASLTCRSVWVLLQLYIL